jgi:hypothetical protein
MRAPTLSESASARLWARLLACWRVISAGNAEHGITESNISKLGSKTLETERGVLCFGVICRDLLGLQAKTGEETRN